MSVGDKVRITLSDGSRVCAADLPAEFEARSWEQNVGWTCGHARKWANPTQPIVRIATILGRSIRVSPNHRFWTPFGWTPASHLKVGDSLAIARGNPAGVSPMALDRAWTIGVLVGDVELSRRIRRYFPEDTPMLVTGPGQEGFRLDSQTIPPECFTWDAERIGAFVSGVLEACGAILDNESGRKIVFAHPSSRLIEGLQALLLVLKAVGRIQGKMYFRGGRPGVAWRLSVCGSSLVALTAVLDPRGRRARNLKSLPPRQAWDSADLIPPSLLEHFGSHLHRGTARRPKRGYQRENLLRHVPRDTPLSRNLELAWDAVTSITQDQAERTWAIEVENIHCMIANDFLTRDSEEP